MIHQKKKNEAAIRVQLQSLERPSISQRTKVKHKIKKGKACWRGTRKKVIR